MAPQTMQRLAGNHMIAADDYQVLLALLDHVDLSTYVQIETKDFAAAIDRNAAEISRWFTRMYDQGVLVRGPRTGRSYTYRLDPSLRSIKLDRGTGRPGPDQCR